MVSSPLTTPPSPGTFRGHLGRLDRERRRTSGWGGLLYVVPALLLLLVFEIWPIFFSIWVSLWRWDVKPLDFIGLENYRRIVVDGFVTRDFKGNLGPGELANTLLVTLYYVLGTVPIVIALSFVFAYLLFRGGRGQGLFRTIYFLPYITASVAVAMVFSLIFNPKFGVANAALEKLGLPGQRWLMDPNPALQEWTQWLGGPFDAIPYWAAGPSVALVVVCIYSIWASLGYGVVIYLSGLTAIPRELADAARLDGAGEWTIMRTIIWPLITPTTAFLVITSTISAFQAFNPIYTLTRGNSMGANEAGAPLDTTLTITVYIYRNFYERSSSVGYAAAVAILLSLMLLALTLLQFRWYSRAHSQV